jgi:phenylacetate-CoA ligase
MNASIYKRFPLLMQSATCSVAGWVAEAGKQLGPRAACIRAAVERLKLNGEQLAVYRDERLRKFVAEACRNVPYYEKLFRELRLSPDAVAGLADMPQLPILSAETVMERPHDFVSSTARRSDFRKRIPGSDPSLTLPWSRTTHWEREAVQSRFESGHGITAGTWCAYFGGMNVVPVTQSRPPYWRINWAGRRVIFSPYHLSEQTVESYADALNHYQCPWMRGSPAVLASLAGLMSAARLSIEFPMSWITTDGEPLRGNQRRAVCRVFGIAPRRSFIDPQGAACITERSDGNLVIDEDYAAVELLPTAEQGMYRVVGTNVSNPAAPLLRFDTGVTVRVAPGSAIDAVPRHVASLEGPARDLVTLPSGARVGRLEHMFDDMPQVLAARILQNADLSIEVDVKMAPGFSADEEHAVTERVAARFGAARFKVNHVDRLVPVTTGKLQVIHSEAEAVNRGVVEPRAGWVSIE